MTDPQCTDERVGEGFAFFVWHRSIWAAGYRCNGYQWCYECTHRWHHGPR